MLRLSGQDTQATHLAKLRLTAQPAQRAPAAAGLTVGQVELLEPHALLPAQRQVCTQWRQRMQASAAMHTADLADATLSLPQANQPHLLAWRPRAGRKCLPTGQSTAPLPPPARQPSEGGWGAAGVQG